MAERGTRMKIRATLISIVVCILIVLYSYFIADTVETRITDAQMTKVDGRFMIASEYRPFVNEDVWYRFKYRFRYNSKRCDPVKREDGHDQEIRMENTNFLYVRECLEDNRD